MKTFEDVIEAHRVATGSLRVNVTLGPESKPEALEAELAKLRYVVSKYKSFTPLEREQAKNKNLTDIIIKISRLSPGNFSDNPALREYATAIADLTDFYFSVNLKDDIEWMQAQRDKS
jgi:hypothetical protein